MEAEYVVISTAMRELIPMLTILKDVYNGLNLSEKLILSINSKIWEDNAGAQTLVNLKPTRVTPRSKYFVIKFCEYLQDPNLDIVLHKMDTKLQLVDLLTKSVSKVQFENLWKLLMGW